MRKITNNIIFFLTISICAFYPLKNSLAEDAISPANEAYIYEACKGGNKLYCRDYLRSMWAGFSLASTTYPDNKESKCAIEKQDIIEKIQWLGFVVGQNTWEDLAKSFISEANVLKHEKEAPLDYGTILSEMLFKLYQEQKGQQLEEESNWLKSSRKSIDLYLSCANAITKKGNTRPDYCYAVISGLQQGLEIAASTLTQIQINNNKCQPEQNLIIADFKERLYGDFICHFSQPTTAEEIMRFYIEGIDGYSPDTIMSIATEPPEYEMIRVIKSICKKGAK